MKSETMVEYAQDALADIKAQNIQCLDVRSLTEVTDFIVIASGTSNRHVKSLADNVAVELKKREVQSIGIEGVETAEWILLDFADIVVHVMLPATREFYDLERLWTDQDRDEPAMLAPEGAD